MRAACLVLGLLALCRAEEEIAEGNLVVQKNLDSLTDFPALFANECNFTVNIKIYNIGEGSAYAVTAEDDWPESGFKLQEGALSQTWDEIPAGEMVELNFTVAPTFTGVFPGFRASVSYKSSKESELQYGYSTLMRELQVIGKDVFTKLTATYHAEWTIFTVLWAAAVLAPFAAWSFIRANHDNGVPKMKSS
mmetsp:Transcript_13187/g.14812  ORF Transcript_13187/g.14812 Transcript_13187/m.14812 type:complete len:192 (+) Transcript_13187:23-598(+)|eukprot:CAMPEP_0205824252 /NCGR_PEP_ID=MMETSP0206-20130828/20198_1 /ASSEMBLY_ACC=CAM_ASM_000279 /TAXON_ID=36767 /ORGANISM="Euplotes focardii, Strain TN1" /LENGTH=191 /DNA_ID=CAMNT_0053122201 /DNA_START=26 /DNA_END=601 /DNA_ORIENTATION=-